LPAAELDWQLLRKKEPSMNASILSVNGKLVSLYDLASVDIPRSAGYRKVKLGKPLLVRYLYFSLIHDDSEACNELMISTFIKSEESKQAAAEAINYFDVNAKFDDRGQINISDFGGEKYGHPLCYYTKSYLGESIYLTLKAMELDKVRDKVIKGIQHGIGVVSSLPAFAEFLPYAAAASVGVRVFQEVVDLFNRDDEIIRSFDLDLHFDLPNTRRLQSGRVLCVHNKSEEVFLKNDNWKLDINNRLIHNKNGEEYRESSYFVLQIDSKENKKLESFDYYLGAADLLKKTNRVGSPVDVVNTAVSLFKSYNDIIAIKEIENLSLDLEDTYSKEKIKAYYNSMSDEVKLLYKTRVRELLSLP
jgi:hypothetical protein